jgi:hypothetical protein
MSPQTETGFFVGLRNLSNSQKSGVIAYPKGINTRRAQERSEAIFILKIRHLKIASSLRSFMPFGYRNDGSFRGSLMLLIWLC